ncbi:hypothetical protein [Streptomyces echinatus]|uniref:hypothetical protein n=1 Tax=Streptomyces echinatus TaxID=67293 RepID=UPI00379FCEE2
MTALMGNEFLHVQQNEVPPAYRAIAEGGWTVAENGAYLLTALQGGYSGSTSDFEDVVHLEASVNGRAMMDYDLPAAIPERRSRLLRRCIAYACLALSCVPSDSDYPVLAYVSLSEGGLVDDTLTSSVTFCTRRPAILPYVDRIEGYTEEALLEVSADEIDRFLMTPGTSSISLEQLESNATRQHVPEWLHVLERCGLHVVGREAIQDAPPVQTAIYAVSGFDVSPTATISAESPASIAELDRQWHHYATAVALYGDNGDFLILPPVSGASEIGWVRVNDSIGRQLPSRIAGVTGSPEFLAVSVDGRRLCAASVEEHDYWVVVHDFS